MNNEVCGRGERSVSVAVEVRRWNTASVMKCGAEVSSGSGSSSEGGGSAGERSFGVGIVRLKIERAVPRWGWEGMERAWVRRVRVVL